MFLADGAEWIWDRVPMIAEMAGLKNWVAAVDFSHTMGYVKRAVNESCRGMKNRNSGVEKIKRALLKGRTENALSILRSLPGCGRIKEVQDAIRYIADRRSLMKYDQLRSKNLPIGSGAVESAVRRVINLRIKSPGMFWKEENAEAVMYLRANALSDQWDNMLKQTYQYTRTSRKKDWKWKMTPYSIKADENQIAKLSQLVIRDAA